MKHILFFVLAGLIGSAKAQQVGSAKASDSVVIKVGKSHVIVAIKDTLDIQTFRELDMQALIQDAMEQVKDSDGPAEKDSTRVYRFRKFPNKYVFVERDFEKMVPLKSLHSLEEELEWLEQQEKFLESGSELDRETIKRIIKERAERIKERVQERSFSDSDNFEFEMEIESDDQEDSVEEEDRSTKKKGTYQSTHFDLGTLNYLTDGKFPDGTNAPYTLSPQGSMYFAVTNIFRTRLANKMFLEWGLGYGGYYFRYQNDNMQMLKSGTGIEFVPDTRDLDYRKSKFMTHFLQASFIPVIDFGGNKRKPGLFDGVESASFRFGLGPYVGYRTDSYTKRVYKDDGERERLRNRDNFYLNNLRYGLRLQMGYREIDLFFTYDLNNLFITGKAPELNVFSFGVSL
jgi:hypothetical protein